MDNLAKILKGRILFLDGAMGTNLLEQGIKPGESPSILNLTNPQAVYKLHRAYVEAGSDIILTNTFSANPLNFSRDKLKKVITEGVKLARQSAQNRAILFGDVGPLGVLIKPYGKMEFSEAVKIYKNIFGIFYQLGLKNFLIETFTSMIEARAAFLAAKAFPSNNVFISFSLQESGKTIMGETVESIAVTFEALGAQGLGINCTPPDVAIDAISKMARVTNLPLIIKPNGGKVTIVKGQVKHTISDSKMAKSFKKFVMAGANIIGGCCGTSPDYIRFISKNKIRPERKKRSKKFILASPFGILEIEKNSTVVVGERLNPSGCKRIKEALLRKDFQVYGQEAHLQEQAGAQALDVSAFIIGLNEKETLSNAVYEVMKNSRLPLFVDTQDFNTAREILSFYPGIAVYNSIPARKKELLKWLPMLKRYGAKAVISLVGRKIPKTYQERIENVNRALRIAKESGFPQQDLVFDPLVFSLATEPEQINLTLEVVAFLKERGLKTILGISNVSFGLPNRRLLNATFAISSIHSGASFIILNPLDDMVMNAVSAARALFNEKIDNFIANAHPVRSYDIKKKITSIHGLTEAIIYGDEKLSIEFTQKLLNTNIPAQKLIDDYISKAFQIVGDYYEAGKFFIPDLLKAAAASKAVLAIIKKKALARVHKRGRIVLATVKGDIHDIGKNIVGMMFESAGYEVIDLGKDVPIFRIIRAVRQYKPDALGLSALLTTTMPEMEKVIKKLKEERLRVKVIIGGPNVTKKYAKKIGAFGAARNVLEGLKILRMIRYSRGLQSGVSGAKPLTIL